MKVLHGEELREKIKTRHPLKRHEEIQEGSGSRVAGEQCVIKEELNCRPTEVLTRFHWIWM